MYVSFSVDNIHPSSLLPFHVHHVHAPPACSSFNWTKTPSLFPSFFLLLLSYIPSSLLPFLIHVHVHTSPTCSCFNWMKTSSNTLSVPLFSLPSVPLPLSPPPAFLPSSSPLLPSSPSYLQCVPIPIGLEKHCTVD